MPLVLEFYKGGRGVLGCFVEDETMFGHSANKLISIRLNSDGAKVKYGEATEEIDATLCNVEIYRKDVKRTKALG